MLSMESPSLRRYQHLLLYLSPSFEEYLMVSVLIIIFGQRNKIFIIERSFTHSGKTISVRRVNLLIDIK